MSSTLMKDVSEYRLSSHFGMGLGGCDQRLSHFLTDSRDRTSFIQRDLSANIKVVQSKRDMNVYMWALMRTKKPMKTFCTGSRYLGEWNALYFSGQGIYRYPHGVIYEGEFNKNGLFNGSGSLTYPNGQILRGMWKNGRLENDYTYIFACNEILDENFKYCHRPDRRFHVEIQNDFSPVGQEYLTADQPTKKLREGCYDVGIGYYDPKLHCIFSFPKQPEKIVCRRSELDSFNVDDEKIKNIIEISAVPADMQDLIYHGQKDDHFVTTDDSIIIDIPTNEKVKWIEKQCRKAWDEPTGYRPDLYEKWMVGRKQEVFLKLISSTKSVCDVMEPMASRSHRKINRVRSQKDQQKFTSFIQKAPSISKIRSKTAHQKQELRKKAEERRIKKTALIS